jgi:UDP-2,3-diacylglucosamine hydrolase
VSKSAYFISDLHLGVNPKGCIKNRDKALLVFLDEITPRASHLFLLGDVFEFWMEYKDYIPKGFFAILCKLKVMSDLGVEIHYVAGNHDFSLGDFFTKELDISVHYGMFRMKLQEREIIMLHGDGMAASDWKYRVASKVLHSKLNQKLFKLLHPDFGMWLARQVSNKSRDANEYKEDNFDEYEEAAVEIHLKEKVDLIIHGHTHQQFHKKLDDLEYAVIGQWISRMDFLCLTEGKLKTGNYFINQD